MALLCLMLSRPIPAVPLTSSPSSVHDPVGTR